MKIAIAKPPKNQSSTTAKGTEQSLFDKLWAKVKKQKQANEKLQLSLDELSVIYQERILPVERQLVLPYSELIEKLLEFFKRKSLSQWQRQELGVWIMENIEMITPLDREKSRELVEQYYQLLANHLDMDMDVDEMHEQMEQANRFDDIDEFFENFEGIFDEDKARQESKKAEYQDDLFGFMNDEQEPEPKPELEKEKFTETANPSDGDKWLKTLFRRTANALHPDKEQDETLKAHKHQLMATLLAARESNDIYTIVNLYAEHVDAADLLVEQEVMTTLCQQLQQQLHDIEMARHQLLDSNPVFSALYNNIYHNNKKMQAKNIDQYLDRINDQSYEITDLAHSIRNLSDLKEILKYRFEESRYRDEWPDFY